MTKSLQLNVTGDGQGSAGRAPLGEVTQSQCLPEEVTTKSRDLKHELE